MTRDQKIEKVRDIIRKGTNFMKYPSWEEPETETIVATEIVDCLEAPADDLTPGDICEVWNSALTHQITFFCGTVNGEKRFSVYRYNIDRPEYGVSYDYYRKLDVFDVLPKAIKVVDLLLDNTQVVDRLHRPEGR
jgi:hypothetical protein